MAKRKKILIVEDEKPLLVAIKSKIESKGYDAIWAEEGEKGLELAKSEDLDLILLDILLPKKDGFEILEELDKLGNKTPIVIISNSGQPVEIERALKLGVKDYLVKADFSPEEVIKKVEKIIGEGSIDYSEKQEDQELEEPKNDAKKTSQSDDLKKGEDVLIVEDDEFLRGVITQKLTQEGFTVRSAIDSEESFRAIKERKPQIILLDLILPGIDGYGILARLKKDNETKDVPVIVLSNLGQDEDIERAVSAGAADYLIKSNFTPGEIVQKVREVLSKTYL